MTDNVWTLTDDPRWLLRIAGWDTKQEASVEAVLALVNGYSGTRAAVEETSSASTPAMFLNGVFDAATNLVAQAAATPEHQVIAAPTPELVVAPDWSRVHIMIDGEPVTPDSAELLEQQRTLDMRRGVLVREWRVRSGDRTTRFRSLRCASLADRHLLVQVLEITPEDWSGSLTLEAIVEGDVTNEGNTRHLINHLTETINTDDLLTTYTSEKGVQITFAAAAMLQAGDSQPVEGEDASTDTAIIRRWNLDVQQGAAYTLHKIVTVFTTRDDPAPAAPAIERLQQAISTGVETLVEQSTAAWAARWATADVEIRGDETTQRRTRFALYHLIGCANPEDERSSPGARSLTGERYKGHVFWDTEIFVFPFFVYTHPPTARALLMYRYHTLPAARDKARAFNYRGALYAWESTDTGVDVTPPFVYNAAGERLEILTGLQEHHISADIAYATWQYWHVTGDDDFMLQAGAELILEIARFWASRAVQGDDKRYHIRKVIGTDEFHEHVDDNAYTNCMAQWSMRRGIEVVGWLRTQHADRWAALAQQIDFDESELATWREIAVRLVNNFDPKTKLFEQHAGYFDLEAFDLQTLEPRKQTMDVVLGWHRLQQTQIIKQADVVMLLLLLGHDYGPDVHEANFRFYEPRTSHDSSLSPSFHALAAARLGDLELAERYFARAANIDLNFGQGVTAAGGVHIAALGGMWQALVFGFGGMFAGGDEPRFEPHVPAHWQTLRFPIRWRGRQLRIEAQGTDAAVTEE
jgi:kojibiose phosphorylase